MQRTSSFGKCLILLTFFTIVLSREECRLQKPKCPQIKSLEPPDFDAIEGAWFEHSNTKYVPHKTRKIFTKNHSRPKEHPVICKKYDHHWLFSVHTGACKNKEDNFWLLATDYTSFGLFYFCETQYTDTISENLMVLTRQRKPTQETLDTIKELIEEYGLSALNLKETKEA